MAYVFTKTGGVAFNLIASSCSIIRGTVDILNKPFKLYLSPFYIGVNLTDELRWSCSLTEYT